jgi:hypothetical protein
MAKIMTYQSHFSVDCQSQSPMRNEGFRPGFEGLRSSRKLDMESYQGVYVILDFSVSSLLNLLKKPWHINPEGFKTEFWTKFGQVRGGQEQGVMIRSG